MREIKFRGRAVTFEERLDDAWVYGSLIENGACPFIVSGGTKVDEDDDGYVLEHQRWAEVIPETVGQFTGSKDKNGREIYEGDIVAGVRELRNARVAVEWHDEECYYKLAGAWWTTKKLTRKNVKNAEVIGNIYENPELLEVAE